MKPTVATVVAIATGSLLQVFAANCYGGEPSPPVPARTYGCASTGAQPQVRLPPDGHTRLECTSFKLSTDVSNPAFFLDLGIKETKMSGKGLVKLYPTERKLI